jgi:hypothetical protein
MNKKNRKTVATYDSKVAERSAATEGQEVMTAPSSLTWARDLQMQNIMNSPFCALE